jgi:hypothetical protein
MIKISAWFRACGSSMVVHSLSNIQKVCPANATARPHGGAGAGCG